MINRKEIIYMITMKNKKRKDTTFSKLNFDIKS